MKWAYMTYPTREFKIAITKMCSTTSGEQTDKVKTSIEIEI